MFDRPVNKQERIKLMLAHAKRMGSGNEVLCKNFEIVTNKYIFIRMGNYPNEFTHSVLVKQIPGCKVHRLSKRTFYGYVQIVSREDQPNASDEILKLDGSMIGEDLTRQEVIDKHFDFLI
tara:strand:- start:79 stop:438 length:360 start_codon:yes stop_codon:yes gene_type:complete